MDSSKDRRPGEAHACEAGSTIETQDELVSTHLSDSAQRPCLLTPVLPHEKLVNSFGLGPAPGHVKANGICSHFSTSQLLNCEAQHTAWILGFGPNGSDYCLFQQNSLWPGLVNIL